MVLTSLLTDEGKLKSIEAANNDGFYLYPVSFGVSELQGALDASRDVSSVLLQWYTGAISSVVIIDASTLQFNCNIPANEATEPKFTKEIYLYGLDNLNQQFLICIAQPSEELVYDPDGELRLRLQVKIENINVANLYQFLYTQATEIQDHNLDMLAHPPIQSAMNKAGIYLQISQNKFKGQNFDGFPVVSPAVNDKDVVYFNQLNNRYEQAIVDGSNAEYGIGIYDEELNIVVKSGIIDFNHSLAPYVPLYLSQTSLGQVGLATSDLRVGYTLQNNKVFLDFQYASTSIDQSNPDGDKAILLDPPLIRNLILQDSNGQNWEVLVDDDGILTTEQTAQGESPLFKVQKIDLSFADFTVDIDGSLVVNSPPNQPASLTDQAYYLRSPGGIDWKFSVDLSNNIVMLSYLNDFTIRSGPYIHWALKQIETNQTLQYQDTITNPDLLIGGPEFDFDKTTPWAFYKDDVNGELETKHRYFNGESWSSFCGLLGDVKRSVLNLANFQKQHGSGWTNCGGQSIAGSLLDQEYGIDTAPNIADHYIKIN